MAETIGDASQYTIPIAEVESGLNVPGTHKTYVAISGYVDPDATPSDTTIYTVPTGKTLWLVQATMSRQDSGNTTPFHDSAGNVASGTALCTVQSCARNYGQNVTKFLQPIAFTKGITIDSARLPGEKDLFYLLEGYLV